LSDAGPSYAARRLEIADVRPWHRLEIDLPDGCVVFVGPNGAGKTSILEALAFVCLGVSPRTTREAEAVRRGAPALHVSLDLEVGGLSTRREIGFAPGTPRRLRRDGEGVRALGDWREPGAVLVFLPEELRAVKGPPAARRRHLDRLLEASVPGYAANLSEYGTALTQRNALLRRVRSGVTGSAGLAPWESTMAGSGAAVIRERRRAVSEVQPRFASWLADLGGGEGGTLTLEPSPARMADVPDSELESALSEMLAANRDTEIKAAQTLSGPHRDDLWIGTHRGSDDVADLRRTGSQGEQRTAVLALVLSHRDQLAAVGAAPILLLDDALSELDPDRRARVLAAASLHGQTLVTTADPKAAQTAGDQGACVFRVDAGAVTRETV
jgi:DNA replication and repair protein RecF